VGDLLHLAVGGADALSGVRNRLSAWLADHHLTPELVDDVVLATNELMANALEHAYPADRPGPANLTACVVDDLVLITVSDVGDWSAPAGTDDRGRGLAIVATLAGEVDIDRIEPGTCVRVAFPATPEAAPTTVIARTSTPPAADQRD
jgi:anti-sigma regulatory factor (Ser/Thr protein kinase)